MRGQALTINEVAATLAREVAGLQGLGVSEGRAIDAVARRHRVSSSTTADLVARSCRRERRAAEAREVTR